MYVFYRYRILIYKRNCNRSRETGQLARQTTHFPWPPFLRCFAIILHFLHLALEDICLKYKKKKMAWLFSLLILPKTGYLSATIRCVYVTSLLRHVSRRHVLPHLGTKCHDGSHMLLMRRLGNMDALRYGCHLIMWNSTQLS